MTLSQTCTHREAAAARTPGLFVAHPSAKRWRNASVGCLHEPALRNPITGIAVCCARAASGHAAAPPSAAINSRRPMMTGMVTLRGGFAQEAYHAESMRSCAGSPRQAANICVGTTRSADRTTHARCRWNLLVLSDGTGSNCHVHICEISSPPYGLGWVERFLTFCQVGARRGWSGHRVRRPRRCLMLRKTAGG